MHAAIGQMDMDTVDVAASHGYYLTFDKPGIYTFYCTRWCGLNHWRMRGTIEVSGSSSDPEPVSVPMYVTLDLDIDAPHDAPLVPITPPSALRGEQLAANLPISLSLEYYRANSPYQVFDELSSSSLTETQRWDVLLHLAIEHNKHLLQMDSNSMPKTARLVTVRMARAMGSLPMTSLHLAKPPCKP
jgi:hypothetical protein